MDIPIPRDDLAALLRYTYEAATDDMKTRPEVYEAQATAVLQHFAAIGVGIPDLVGVSEIAERCGTNRRGVDAWRERQATFPRPRWHIGDRPVWEWSDIVRWGRDTGRVRDGDRWAPLRQPAEATP